MEDKRNILREEQPFGYKLIKNDKALIIFKGRTIKTLQGKEYNKLQRILDTDDAYELQLFLAKITGQFKHGNEKSTQRFFT